MRRDQESRRAAGRVEYGFLLLRIDDDNDKVDDVARRAELPRVALGTEDGEQVLEGNPEPFGVVVFELVADLEESAQRLRVAIEKEGVPEA